MQALYGEALPNRKMKRQTIHSVMALHNKRQKDKSPDKYCKSFHSALLLSCCHLPWKSFRIQAWLRGGPILFSIITAMEIRADDKTAAWQMAQPARRFMCHAAHSHNKFTMQIVRSFINNFPPSVWPRLHCMMEPESRKPTTNKCSQRGGADKAEKAAPFCFDFVRSQTVNF